MTDNIQRSEATFGRDDDYGFDENLSHMEHKVIVALIEQPTVADAARVAGVHRATIYKWLHEPKFQDAYRRVRRDAFTAAVSRLQQAAAGAVATLLEIAEDPSQQGAARVGAARTILDYAVKAIEAEDLSARLEALEQRVEVGMNERRAA